MSNIRIDEFLTNLTTHSILPPNCTYEPLSGGTVSEVGVIVCEGVRRYVLKLGEAGVLAAEVAYLQRYRGNSLLPKVQYVDEAFRFLLMDYVAGVTKYPVADKRTLLATLVQDVINHYEPLPDTDKWGWLDAPTPSWGAFFTQEVLAERGTIGDHLSEADHQLILDMTLDIAAQKSATVPYLLHGDFGAHNFLFDEEKLVGVIDPFPVIGEPIYDLIYAFCSTPDDLDIETLTPVLALLRDWQPANATALHHNLLLGLYLRLGKCIRHHEEDLPRYLAVWEQWKMSLPTT